MRRLAPAILAVVALIPGATFAQQPPEEGPRGASGRPASNTGNAARDAVREDSGNTNVQRQYDKPFPTGMNWVAASLNGKPLAAGREKPSFMLDDQMRARGYGGCNAFSVVAYPIKGQKLIVGPIAHTKTACDKSAETQERAFFVALRTAQQWDYDAGKLTIKGQGGQLVFERGI